MTTLAATAMKVVVRCTGLRKDGSLCNRVIAILNVEAFIGPQQVKCKCGHWEVFE